MPNLIIITLLFYFVNVLYCSTDMKLIIGLGNPEERYQDTRHNMGFKIVAHYGGEHGLTFQLKDKFKAYITELSIAGEKIILAMPTTYYNLSGEAARAISDFYKIAPEDVLVVHDELALPFSTIRARKGGGDAGNNGVKSVTEHLGPDTARLRIGVYNDLRDKIDDADFVLSKFTAEESKVLNQIFLKTNAIIDAFISDQFEPTTHT